ncbi:MULTISPECIES: hypothetical protein [unclassified Yoonia]|uniref:hypothetical protein n=1 Tax=unclassified Yoonia TaxID=2629118 RepID=UPI002AFF4448|nr:MULTISPECIES: hypothetical protein [unclassified Yoonia]
MITEADARELAEKLAEATKRVERDYEEEDIGGEEDFSSQLCGRLKETLDSFQTETIVWQVETDEAGTGRGTFKARTLSKVSEEPFFGADLIMVIDVAGAGYEVKKGFLAQAKRLEPGKYLSTDAYNDLRKQCGDMLNVTSASYVFLYSTTGVTVVSANAVTAALNQDLWALPTYDLEILYYDFAICWIGDQRLRTTTRRSLKDLRASLDANAAIKVLGTPRHKDAPPRKRGRSIQL